MKVPTAAPPPDGCVFIWKFYRAENVAAKGVVVDKRLLQAWNMGCGSRIFGFYCLG